MWTPKYRFRILKNNVGKEVYRCINVYCNQLGCEVVDSVGINEEIIRRYVRHQEKKERVEQQQLAQDYTKAPF